MSAQRLSKYFQAEDADAIFESSDGVTFKVHRERLNMFSEGFAAPDMVKTDEKIPLTETAETLELLFQYCYPRRGPSMKQLQFRTVNDLAEAAEKYQVYMALEPCKDRMQDFFIFHALGVLKYATKHDYSELMESAKEQAILLEPLETFRYAVESKNHALLDDAGARALLVAPVEVFELAAQHGSDRLVEKVAMAAMNYQKPTSVTLNLFGNRPLEMNEEGAISLRTTYIFKILEYAAEHEQQELTNKAAVLSRNKPDFAFVAGQVRHRTLVVWLQYYNQFIGQNCKDPDAHTTNAKGRSVFTQNFYSLWLLQSSAKLPS